MSAFYPGIQTRPTVSDPFNYTVTSLTMNFDNSRIAVGTTDGNGTVRIYDYDSDVNEWSGTHTLNGPSSGSGFGQSIDMDWAGTRLAVGANTVSRVYVYDFNGSTWSYGSNVITSPSGSASDFGFSVSISKDIPDTIAVGAPAHNNVHVYHIINDAWSEAFSNIGTDIENIAPIDTSGTNNYVLKPEFNRYGECVRLSSLGDYLIIGQPGTVLSELNSTNTNGLSGTVNVSSYTGGGGEYQKHFNDNLNRQQGSARVFKTDNLWYASNVQIGSLLIPDIESTTSNTNQINSPGEGWSFPGFGMQVDISTAGDFVVVSAPLYSVLGGNYTYHNGQIYTFIYQDGEWIKKDVFTGDKLIMLGISMKLDYTGNRIAISGSNIVDSSLHVLDWNGNNWFNTQPEIVNFSYNLSQKTYITDGKFALKSMRNTTKIYDFLLTQSVIGNNLVQGYLAADELFVGSNDNDNVSLGLYSRTKRISFGGTYFDNSYEGATIENRVYREWEYPDGVDDEGRSELLIAKTSTNPTTLRQSSGVDLIRFKAMEIHLDHFNGNKYAHESILAMNYQRNVAIGLPFLIESSSQAFRGTIDAKAKLDVNGSTYIRNRLNVNVDGGNNILGAIGEQPDILFDTRNGSSINGTTVYSNTMVDSYYGEGNTGTINSPATYSVSERAFDLTSGGSITVNNGTLNQDRTRISMWIKLSVIPTSDTQIYHTNFNSTFPYYIYITSTGFKVTAFDTSNTTKVYTANYTHVLNTWVHITVYTQQNTDVEFRVNGQSVTETQPSPQIQFMYSGFGAGINMIIGGGSGMYIGMPMIWSGYANRSPTALMLYNNGPPSEMLKVGGDAVVTGKLGVGVTNPTEALEVSGNIIRDGRTYVNRIIYTSTDGEFPNIYVGQFNTQTEPSKIHIIDDGNSKGSGATFTVVRHYSAAPIINGEQGSAFVTYKFYYEEINVNAYYLWVHPEIYNSGTYDIHIDSPNYSYGTIQTIPTPPTECNYGLISRGKFNYVNVGIGTTNPTEALEVSGNVYAEQFKTINAVNFENDNPGDMIVRKYPTSTDRYGMGQYSSGTVRLFTSGSFGSASIRFSKPTNDDQSQNGTFQDMMTVLWNGNVGIGTTNPTYKLDVVGDSTSVASVSTSGIATTQMDIKSYLSNAPNRSSSRINFWGNPAFNNGDNGIRQASSIQGGYKDVGQNNYNWENSYISFIVKQNVAGTDVETMTITNGGRVGIGTNNPSYSYLLDVNGSIQCNGFNNTASDDRIKYNEEPVSNALTIINLLKPQKYEKIIEFPSDPEGHWIPTDEDWESTKESFKYINEYGLIAQDVREIQELSFLVEGDETYSKTKSISVEEYDANIHTEYSPDNVYIHSVTSNIISESVFNSLTPEEQVDYVSNVQSYSTTIQTDTPLSLNYNGIFVLAVGAIQELDKKNKALEAQLASVLARLDALENPP